MNNVLNNILDMIRINEKFKDIKLAYSDDNEIKFTYFTFIVVVRYENERILQVNGFKTFEKYVMDKLENCDWYNQPSFKNHYHHHDSHYDDICDTIPSYNRSNCYLNSDVMKRPNSDYTLLHATLNDYAGYIADDYIRATLIIDFIDEIIKLRG